MPRSGGPTVHVERVEISRASEPVALRAKQHLPAIRLLFELVPHRAVLTSGVPCMARYQSVSCQTPKRSATHRPASDERQGQGRGQISSADWPEVIVARIPRSTACIPAAFRHGARRLVSPRVL